MRFRLAPTPAQEQALLEHCAHARYVWNLAVEQHQHWRPGRASAPGYGEQSRQLTEARKAFSWLAAGFTAKNMAAGRAVTARGALQPPGGAVNREPQPVPTSG
jgi:hypothetical protein